MQAGSELQTFINLGKQETSFQRSVFLEQNQK
jgi:hypothetical protein